MDSHPFSISSEKGLTGKTRRRRLSYPTTLGSAEHLSRVPKQGFCESKRELCNDGLGPPWLDRTPLDQTYKSEIEKVAYLDKQLLWKSVCSTHPGGALFCIKELYTEPVLMKLKHESTLHYPNVLLFPLPSYASVLDWRDENNKTAACLSVRPFFPSPAASILYRIVM